MCVCVREARWRKGSAFDSRSNGWEFDSLPGHFFFYFIFSFNYVFFLWFHLMEVSLPLKSFKKGVNAVRSTQHTLLTFLPARVLLELKKTFNLFFLFLCFVVATQGFSPFSGVSYILCVAFVLSSSLVKHVLLEIRRRKEDARVNAELFPALRAGALCEIKREDINIGDLILLHRDRPAPVNALLLGAFTQGGGTKRVYVETSSLNGESALVVKSPIIPSMCSTGALTELDTRSLYSIRRAVLDPSQVTGVITWRSTTAEGGAHEEQTEEHYTYTLSNVIEGGCSIYGHCTGVALSLGKQKERPVERVKASLFMSVLSQRTLFVLLIYLLALSVSCASSCYFLCRCRVLSYILLREKGSQLVSAFKCLIVNLVLFSNLVPLSLFVTLDGLRVAHSVYVHSDPGLAAGPRPRAAYVRRYGAVEDMGMVTHAVLDKTGTLTRNQMVLKGVHIRGHPRMQEIDSIVSTTEIDSILGHPWGGATKKNADQSDSHQNNLKLCLLCILLCNSVEVIDREYRGVSQEEVAALKALSGAGIFLSPRDEDKVSIKHNGRETVFRVLGVMPFSAARRCMGVIVETPSGVLLLMKGAQELWPHAEAPAEGKYRVLHMGALLIPEGSPDRELITPSGVPPGETRTDGESAPKSAASPLKLTEEEAARAISRASPRTRYVGALYIEDTLQGSAAETVKKLRRAGVHVWMLTGDRKESALACAAASSILHANSRALTAAEGVSLLEQEISRGECLLKQETGVIFYRAAPESKRRIVHLLRKEGAVVLSAGDGENDVGMIEEADVGVCVMGREGKKAEFASDAVIPEFSQLAPLMLGHGRTSLERLKAVYLFYVFKCVCVSVCQCLYGVTVGASGAAAGSTLFVVLYNSVITSPLAVEIGLFRRTCLARSLRESILVGAAYGGACFFVVYEAFGGVDVLDSTGALIGHSRVAQVFSLVLYIATVSHFVASSDCFVSFSALAGALTLGLFVGSLAADGGLRMFACASVYLIAAHMVTLSLLIERASSLLRSRQPYRS